MQFHRVIRLDYQSINRSVDGERNEKKRRPLTEVKGLTKEMCLKNERIFYPPHPPIKL